MKIAIHFGDNDFHSCFCGILRTLLNAYRYTEQLPNNKTILKNIINNMSESHYLLFQHDSIAEHTREYIKISEEDILIDNEVDEYSKLTSQHNSDTYVLNTELDYDGNSAVYCL